jgi:hypothetical protein
MKTPKTFVLEVTHRHILEVIFGHPALSPMRNMQHGSGFPAWCCHEV